MTRGNIREQRGRGNVTETTDCGAYVASAWADIHRAWVKASLGKGVQAVCNPWNIAWRQGGSRGKSCERTRNTFALCHIAVLVCTLIPTLPPVNPRHLQTVHKVLFIWYAKKASVS